MTDSGKVDRVVTEGQKITLRFLSRNLSRNLSRRSKFGWKDNEISSGHAEGAPRGQLVWEPEVLQRCLQELPRPQIHMQ